MRSVKRRYISLQCAIGHDLGAFIVSYAWTCSACTQRSGNALNFAERIAHYWSDKSYLVQEAKSAILNTFGDRIPAFTFQTSKLLIRFPKGPLPLELQATHIHAAVITKPTVGEI